MKTLKLIFASSMMVSATTVSAKENKKEKVYE